MLELISNVVKISAHRDRTEINSAMVEALMGLFSPQALTIFRCYPGKRKTVVFACAGFGPHGQFLRNAYLPDRKHCRPLEHDPLLSRCRRKMSPVMDLLEDGSHRIVFPVSRLNVSDYLIDLTLPGDFAASQRIVLMGLVEYFSNHISLLDYGEADTLTGLSTRKTFDKHLFELLGQAAADEQHENNGSKHQRRTGSGNNSSHWLAVCDIDHFKRFNDNFGHLMGDEVLVALAAVMRQSFRFDDHLFRFGGEEFVALLQPTDLESAAATLERFRTKVEKQAFIGVGHVTISVGFSRLQANDTPAKVIDRADEALYYAKHHGRNRVECYEQLVAENRLPFKKSFQPENGFLL